MIKSKFCLGDGFIPKASFHIRWIMGLMIRYLVVCFDILFIRSNLLVILSSGDVLLNFLGMDWFLDLMFLM